MKLNNPYETIIEASHRWQAPLAHIIQAAGHDQFPLFAMADGWTVEKNGSEKAIDGWVQLDKQDVIKAITQDYVKVKRVRKDNHWFVLQESRKVLFGALFIEKAYQGTDTLQNESSKQRKSHKPQDEPLLTVKQAADYLNLAPNTLDKHRSNGTGPEYTTVGSRNIRYRKSALDNWSS